VWGDTSPWGLAGVEAPMGLLSIHFLAVLNFGFLLSARAAAAGFLRLLLEM
jgi:hypothetical protein